MEEENKIEKEALDSYHPSQEKGDDTSGESQDTGGPNLGARPKQITEKGRNYSKEMKEKQLNKIYKEIKEKTEQITVMLNGNVEESSVKEVYGEFQVLYDTYLSMRSAHKSLLDEQESDPFNVKDQMLITFKNTVQSWFLNQPKQFPLPRIYPEDSVSQLSLGRKSSSTRSSVLSARIREEQNIIELQMKKEALKKKKELELARLNLSHKEEQLTLDTELAISKAKTKVLDDFVKTSSVSTKLSTTGKILRAEAPLFVPEYIKDYQDHSDHQPRHQDHQPCHQDHQPLHQDHQSRHPDHQPYHPDHQPRHQDHQPLHQDHQSRHPDHQPYHPDHQPRHQDHQPLHQDHQSRHPDHQSYHQDHQPLHQDHQSRHPDHHQDHQPRHQDQQPYHPDHQPRHQDPQPYHQDHQPRHQDHQPPHQDHQPRHQDHPPYHQDHQPRHQDHPPYHQDHQPRHPDHHQDHQPRHQDQQPPHQYHQPRHQDHQPRHQDHQPSHQDHQPRHLDHQPRLQDHQSLHQDHQPRHQDQQPPHQDHQPYHQDHQPRHRDHQPYHQDHQPRHQDHQPRHQDHQPRHQYHQSRYQRHQPSHQDHVTHLQDPGLFRQAFFPYEQVPGPFHQNPASVYHDYGGVAHNYPAHNELLMNNPEVSTNDNKYQIPHYQTQEQPSNQIASVVRHLKKPAPEIHKFSGNPLEFRRFIRQFKSKIVANTDDDEERLNYLEQYTGGDAYRIVSGYGYLPSGTGYTAALRELEDRYGNNTVIANAFIKRALEWPIIKSDNPKDLDELGIFLAECQNAISSIEAVRVLEYPDNIKRLVMKLPYFYHDRWRNIVLQTRQQGQEISFLQLVEFVKREARKANDPTFGKDALRTTSNQNHYGGKPMGPSSTKPKGSFATGIANMYSDETGNSVASSQTEQCDMQRTAFTQPCLYCNEKDHNLETCDVMVTKPYEERIDFIKKNRLCFSCLEFGHQSRNCKNKAICKKCKGKHPSVCHVKGTFVPPAWSDRRQKADKELSSASVQLTSIACPDTGAGGTECTMAIIPVTVKMSNSFRVTETYAFLDPGSSASFCTEKLMRRIGGKGKPVKVTLDTMGNPHTMQTFVVNGIEIGNLERENYIEMPKMYTKDRLPVSNEHIPTSDDLKRWPHLKDIKLPQIDAEIELLIGNDVPAAYSPLEVRTGPPGSPHATKSALGWISWNVLRSVSPGSNTKPMTVNRTGVIDVQEIEALQQLEAKLEKSINLDYPEHFIDDKRENSQHDKQFLEKVNDSIEFVNGHYSIALPFKKDSVVFPDNEYLARQRLRGLKSKMASNLKFKDDYCSFMTDVINKGYAQRVPAVDLTRDDGKVWYIPHHGVYHPHKPEKIRVVFDCAAQYQGVSLNTELLQGPDLTNSLLAVLLRFRQEKIALIGDIEAMFYQVQVPQEDSDCLRFLWWPDGDTKQEPVAYRMVVHLFGAVSSPSCSNAALRKTAVDNQHLFGPEVAEVVKRNFYVDDCVTSSESEEKALKLRHDVTALCKLGGFHLTKWNSNNRAVLQDVEELERAKEMRSLNLDSDSLPNGRALGVHWCPQTDTIGFSIQIKERPETKRGILSTVSSIYDPLGFACPFLLTGRILLQNLCRLAVGWDDEIPEDIALKWREWMTGLYLLEDISINRCIKPSDFDDLLKCEMHVFSDASEVGYGICIYLRQIDIKGLFHCSLVLGKARVTPLKKVSIPRLELTAATVAVRLSRMVTKELDLKIDETYFWTDSMSVIRYLNNKSTRFHTFVANRVAVILDGSDPGQWKHVESKLNPADCASRGMPVHKFLKHKEWFHGPDFLSKPMSEWPPQDGISRQIPEDDKEVKQVSATITKGEPDVIQDLVNRQSRWLTLRSILGWVLVAVRRFKAKQRPNVEKKDLRKRLKDAILSKDTLQDAETFLVKYVQHNHFSKELKMLSNESNFRRSVWKRSPLRKLDPFLSDGVIRVGGRISNANIPFAAKHPAILPKDSRVSQLYLDFIHRCVGHLGRNSMLTALRQKFWMIGASTNIKSLVSKCVTCRKYQAKAAEQKMANLPSDRVTPVQAPLSSVGLDFFGPFQIKRARSMVKRYGLVFTCLTTRAVHLEVVSSLTTDSCINAIRRMVSRRGPVDMIRSDNGTNLVGSERELREEIQTLNQSTIHKSLQRKNIRWVFNPPGASHHGGVWERMIRTIRKILYSLLQQQTSTLNDEALSTLFCEVESIINGRPITSVSNDCMDLEPLTPNHLLLLRGGETLPPGEFGPTDNYPKRRWRQVQYLADVFWRRWSKEYLPMLQARQKWLHPKRNLLVNDIVLVVDTSPRNSWCLGRIVEVYKDEKGLVRSVKVKTKSTTIVRPITKLCLILEADLEEPSM